MCAAGARNRNNNISAFEKPRLVRGFLFAEWNVQQLTILQNWASFFRMIS
jgi:hypothetical protein